jgi:formylglycine-generating enzyme required for sulfatase activity
MRSYLLSPNVAALVAFAFVEPFAVAQTRTNSPVALPVIGADAIYRYDYPATGVGNLCVYLMTARMAGSYPANIAGFNSVGSVRCDLGNIFMNSDGLQPLGSSLQDQWVVPIPNDTFLAGIELDVQTIEIGLGTNSLFWSDQDVEATIMTAGPQPSQALGMVFIRSGAFQMGSLAVGATASPVHSVTLMKPFWIARHEVTQSEYQALMGTNPSFYQGPSYPSAAQMPVERVTWSDAMAFCAALNASEVAAGRVPSGYQYRLPTEAEWEYCCRAGTTSEFNTGASLATSQANWGNLFGRTTVVESYGSNTWGLYDMHANVAEWCLDSTNVLVYPTSSPVTDPLGARGTLRLTRGGSFANPDSSCRSASRTANFQDFSNYDLGFRVVLAPVLVPDAGLEMARVDAGGFAMGSLAVGGNSIPVRSVSISRPFWVGRNEVTQGQYQAVMGANPSSFAISPRHPVETVTWDNAMAYCAALTAREVANRRMPAGYQYRLPTEAEWEYCCRAGTPTEWNTGNSLVFSQANFALFNAQTRSVQTYAPNAWGLYETHGNVLEWCLDRWNGDANYPTLASVDPYNAFGTGRVCRGGGWNSTADNCRSARRAFASATLATNGIGFRVVLAPVLVP